MARIKMLGLVVMAVVLLPNTAPAQPPDTLWTKTYGGSDNEGGNSVAQTRDGGYIIAGETRSYGAGNWDVYLIRTDTKGDTLWTKTYGGSSEEGGNSVAQTRDGGYIIAGETRSYGAGSWDVYLIKTDTNGDTLWTKTYGGSFDDRCGSVAQTTDGGYIIIGVTYSYGALAPDSSNIYLIKTDAVGDTLWTKTYGGNSNDDGHSVAQTSDGGYIVTGETFSLDSIEAGSWDVYLTKTDVDGDTLWTKTYGGNDIDVGYSVAQTDDNGYIIVGQTFSYGAGSWDIYLIRTDANGDTLWTKTYGGNDVDVGYSVAQTDDSGYIIAGETLSYGAGSSDVYLIRTGTNGDTLWTKTCGGSSWDGGNSVAQTSDGGYIIVGITYFFEAELFDVYIIKLGSEKGFEEYSPLPVESLNFRINKNPFSTSTTISYQIQARSKVSLSVFDVTGREIKRLVDGVQERGDYHFYLDMTGYAPGVYFCRLETKDYHATQKIVRVR